VGGCESLIFFVILYLYYRLLGFLRKQSGKDNSSSEIIAGQINDDPNKTADFNSSLEYEDIDDISIHDVQSRQQHFDIG